MIPSVIIFFSQSWMTFMTLKIWYRPTVEKLFTIRLNQYVYVFFILEASFINCLLTVFQLPYRLLWLFAENCFSAKSHSSLCWIFFIMLTHYSIWKLIPHDAVCDGVCLGNERECFLQNWAHWLHSHEHPVSNFQSYYFKQLIYFFFFFLQQVN